MNILAACAHPAIFASWFKRPKTYEAWFAFLAALFGLAMSEEQAALYRTYTGRTDLPSSPSKEAWLIVGRRGGKSFMMALIAVFLACFKSYAQYLAPGERATVLVIAADRKQARVILRYVKAMLTRIPSLSKMIERETAETFDLNNSVTIEVGTASFKSTRGYTYAAVVCDEIAYWPTGEEAAAPDAEILAAIRPGMSTIPDAMLICASSPYARRGSLFEAFQKWFGKSDAPLVWRAPTRAMNPTVPQKFIDDAFEKDPASAAAEYGAEFRGDIESYISIDTVRGCVSTGRAFRPYVSEHTYYAFCDPAGGSGKDSMTLSIAHQQGDMIVIDYIGEAKPPFSPQATVSAFADALDVYGIRDVTGDRWGGEFVAEPFKARGKRYFLAKAVRSELYQEFLPLLNSGRVDLLDNPKLVAQLASLERRSGRGKDAIDHPPGGHDDVSNAVAGVAWLIELAPKVPVAMFQTPGGRTYGGGIVEGPQRTHTTGFSGFDYRHGIQPRTDDPFRAAALTNFKGD